jgi:hypothetical protein
MSARQPRPIVSEARLSCGCVLGFRDGHPVVVVVTEKSAACPIANHMAGAPVFDRRDAIRPATRPLPPLPADYEES